MTPRPEPVPPVHLGHATPAELLRLRRATAVLRVGDWWVALGSCREQLTSLADLGTAAAELQWTGDGGHPAGLVLAGWVTDDLSRTVLGLDPADDRAARAPLPPLRFGLHDHALWVRDGRVLALGDVDAATGLWRDRRSIHGAGSGSTTTSLGAGAHAQAVRRIQDWIAAGDVYQVNLTRWVSAGWDGDGRALAQRLWAGSAPPHAAWIDAGDVEIVSMSPETFLRARGTRLTMSPIKGTSSRGDDPASDAASRAALLASDKDRAEHIMIVDLQRNDLGRVCRVGTVLVPRLLAPEPHADVWHLVSDVVGELRPGIGLDQVLAALFPSGSVTGAPKRMAVARTALVEPVRRGVYCGAIGVIGRGFADLSVAIRTAVVHDGRAHYGTGGGIVAQSDAGAEWRETVAKAAPFVRAVSSCG